MMRRLLGAVACLATLCLAAPVAAAPPTVDLHDLEWYVHIDLIDAGAGKDLAFYEALIDDAMAQATRQLEGNQGPADTPCCTRIDRAVSVSTFGSVGDDLDVLDSASQYATIAGIGTPGSQAFLVDSLTHCGGPAPTSIGCALSPACDGDGSDDPDLWMVITMDAFDGGNGVQTLAHERGHNACLSHVDVEECQLMRPGGGGGCLDAGECSDFQAGRTTTGGSCGCHVDASGGLLGDGESCTDVASGLCSGGVCGDPAGAAAATLVVSAGPGFGVLETTDDALLMSGLTGGWTDLGPFGTSGEVIEGLAYAVDSTTLYGVVSSSTDDRLVTVDAATGAITATVGTISNGGDELIALAYDPGATTAAGDDLLIALETDGTFEDVVTIDPDMPNTTTYVGSLAFGAADGFRGLAYDSANAKLYTSSPFADGIYEIDLTTCPSFCDLIQQTGLGLQRFDAGLAYSADTGLLHLVGGQLGVAPLGPRTLYDVVDPTTFVPTTDTIQVDAFTTGGLASIPNTAAAPVPALGPLGVLALAGLTIGVTRRALDKRASRRLPTA